MVLNHLSWNSNNNNDNRGANINSPYGSGYYRPYNPVSHWNPIYDQSYNPIFDQSYNPSYNRSYNPSFSRNSYPPYWPVPYNRPVLNIPYPQPISYPQAIPYPQPIPYPQYIPVPYVSDPYMVDEDYDPGHCCNTVVSHHCHSGGGRRRSRRGLMSDQIRSGWGILAWEAGYRCRLPGAHRGRVDVKSEAQKCLVVGAGAHRMPAVIVS